VKTRNSTAITAPLLHLQMGSDLELLAPIQRLAGHGARERVDLALRHPLAQLKQLAHRVEIRVPALAELAFGELCFGDEFARGVVRGEDVVRLFELLRR